MTLVQAGKPLLIRPSRYDNRLVFIGRGLYGREDWILYKTPKGWRPIPTDRDLPRDMRYIAEQAPGIIWMGHRTNGYYRVEIPDLLEPSDGVDRLGAVDTLSIRVDHIVAETSITGGKARLFIVHDKLYFATNKGLKRFDPQTETLVPDVSLGAALADTTTYLYLMVPGNNGEIWVKSSLTENSFGKLVPKVDGSFTLEEVPIMNRVAGPSFNLIYPDPYQEDVVWFGGSEVLVKYNLSQGLTRSEDYPPLIRRVLVNGDSLIYDGDLPLRGAVSVPPPLSYEDNNLRIEYAATSFDLPEKNRYQVWLAPFDETWSDWTFETQKDYTNVPEGNYTFHLRSKNLYGVESKETVFAFEILAPWYRTWWAYLGYLFLLAGFVGIIVKWRERNLKAQNRALEAVIADRTRELAEKNEKLLALDETKSRFFTNISHEFRTPLTVISGMVDQITSQPDKWRARGLEMIKRNSEQVLGLINQILDLRKLEAGSLKPEYIQGNVVPFLRYLIESLQSYGDDKGISLHFQSTEQEIWTDYDPDKLQTILTNLLSNAIKFTSKGGEVWLAIQVTARLDGEEIEGGNSLVLIVSDTGKGISAEKLPHIFGRFYQGDDSSTREEAGTGIGLAIVYELVQLLGGEIAAKSQAGKGSTFTVQLPISQRAPIDEAPAEKPTSLVAPVPTASSILPPGSPPKDLPSLLLVEDNEDVIQYLIACLESHYDLSVTHNGQEGINQAIIEVPDLIISDVMMPLKDGFELCETLKEDERTSHIPIVLLTAKADIESRISGWERGADAYLAKPFDQPELLAVLKKLLLLRRNLQERYRASEVGTPSPDPGIKQEDAFIQKLRSAIIDHLDDPTLNVTKLCDLMSMSRTQLHNKVKALTGRSATSFVRFVRLGEAKKLLADPHLQIAEVAYQVGFSDPAYFSRSFAEAYGHAPSEARGK